MYLNVLKSTLVVRGTYTGVNLTVFLGAYLYIILLITLLLEIRRKVVITEGLTLLLVMVII